MGEREANRSTTARGTTATSGRSTPYRPHLTPPVHAAPLAEDPEEERLTVLPPIVWTAGIAGVVVVLLLSG
jgi:hypothetical protein